MINKILFFPLISFFNSKKPKLNLKNKTILITGASFGIGESLTKLLAKEECHLILVARSIEKLELLKQKFQNSNAKIDIFVCDLFQTQEVKNLIESLKAFTIDIFVSNAGKSIRRSIFNSLDRMHDFERTIHLNFLAPVELSLALIPNLVKNKGHIINISALNVKLLSAPKWSAYQSSKSAFDEWFSSVSIELNAHQVATTSLYLPLVRTRMIKPTKAYDSVPALLPNEVAMVILNAIHSRKKYYAPWWLTLAQLFSILFRPLLEWIMIKLYNKGFL
jgi:short-subunit dehydrogenase